MNLAETRITFTRCLGKLLVFTEDQGIPVLGCELLRSQDAAKWNAAHCRVVVHDARCEQTKSAHATLEHAFKPIGIANSVHVKGLAIDILIIKDGQIENGRGQYELIANYWKGLHELARWGGDFNGGWDLGHYSFEWMGTK